MKGHQKYSAYSFEDFLQDDFFIDSVKRPTRKSMAFWTKFLESYPEQSNTYRAAQLFLEDVIRPQRISDMWDTVQMEIRRTRKLGKIRKMVYYSAAAASIAALLVVRFFFLQSNDNDIMNFVSDNTHTIGNSGEVQLIVSEQKTFYLQGEEAVITYDSASIHTGSKKLPKNEASTYNQLIVPYGKNSVLTLHDGTKIWVNAGTTLVYPVEFEAGKREIYVNGEIFLDVTPDAKRPFIVRTNDFRIQVLGTKFNVQAYASDEKSRIALESGLVNIISENAGNTYLNPNQIFEQSKNGHSSVQDADVSVYTSWIHGLYIYESERLDVILKRLERYYGKEIVADPSVSEITCSGKLDLKDNVEYVLLIICSAAEVEYAKEEEKYIISYQP